MTAAPGDAAGSRPRAARGVLITAAVVVTALASATFAVSPLNGEDYALTRVFGDASIVERLSWVVQRSQLQLETWNARLGEQLSILWLSMPDGVFQLAWILTFLAFAFLVGTFLSRRPTPLVATALAAVTVMPLWPLLEVLFWRTVNAGYFQTLVITLACMYFYRDDAAVRRLAGSRWLVVPVAALGVLVGLSFENVPVAVIPFLAASTYLARPGPGTWRAAVPIVAVALGWVVLLAAPSTRLRTAYYRDTLQVPETGVLSLGWSTLRAGYGFLSTGYPLLLAAAAAVVLLWRWGYSRRRLVLICATVALVAASVIPAPYVEERAFSLAWALLLALCVSALHELWLRYASGRPVLVGAVCLLLLYVPVRAFSLYSDFAERVTARDAAIRSAVGSEACAAGLPISLITTDYPRRYLNNRDPWVASSLAQVSQYYGCTLVLR